MTHSPNLWTRETYDEPVDNDGLRVQRRAHSIGAGKRSDELEFEELFVTEENCKLFFVNDNRYFFNNMVFSAARFFLNQAELRSGFLEREC